MKKYKHYIDDIVYENPFVSSLFTDQLKKNLIENAKSEILISFKNSQKMGSLILKEILSRHINAVYDINFVKV